MTTYPTSIPAAVAPMVGGNGLITQPWLLFLTALWNRTGGSSGGGTTVVIDDTSSAILAPASGGIVNAFDDADAASKGVAVNSFYRNGSVFQVRVA